ncbi:hypothetical protein [Serratia marcescens]|jgi:hypothetical protein|uniref:hypothetical protein n=1 Tax=Serratia marcescens TaxID=615 RepID=UPI001F15041C|nr:hypothetical protein [Serratia marcescens]
MNTYKITIIKDGVSTVQHQSIDGDIDELHIVSMNVIRKELAEEMEAIHKANSFKEKYLPALVFFGAMFGMALIVLNNRGLI